MKHEEQKEYREANGRVQKAVKKAKEDWIGAQCEEIETYLNKKKKKKQQESISAGEGPQRNRLGPQLSRTSLGNVLLKKKRFSADGQNIAQNCCGDNAILDCSQSPEEDLQPNLSEKVEIAVASLKKGKSAGVDNIPAELVQAGGETMINVLTEICNRIWRTGEWPTLWTQ